MSLARTALRLAVIEALNADPVIAAMCPGRVFDSRVGDTDSAEVQPSITVTTEDDKGLAYSANNGGPPFNMHCNLVFEIEMRAFRADPGEKPALVAPESYPELELAIDLLQERAINAISTADNDQRRLVELVSRRIHHASSSRFVSTEMNGRIAMRLVTLEIEMKVDDQADVFELVTNGPLPEPLRSVCAAMPAGSHGQIMCQALLDLLPTSTAPVFTGADVTIAVLDDPSEDIGGTPPINEIIDIPPYQSPTPFAETQPHFVGHFAAAAYKRFRYN